MWVSRSLMPSGLAPSRTRGKSSPRPSRWRSHQGLTLEGRITGVCRLLPAVLFTKIWWSTGQVFRSIRREVSDIPKHLSWMFDGSLVLELDVEQGDNVRRAVRWLPVLGKRCIEVIIDFIQIIKALVAAATVIRTRRVARYRNVFNDMMMLLTSVISIDPQPICGVPGSSRSRSIRSTERPGNAKSLKTLTNHSALIRTSNQLDPFYVCRASKTQFTAAHDALKELRYS